MNIFRKGIQKFLVIAIFVVFSCNCSAQASLGSTHKKFSDRLFVGGALGLSVGNITQIDIMPIGGIWIIPQWSVGVGGRYSYYSQRMGLMPGEFKPYRSHIWGGSVFTQVLPIPDFSKVLPMPFKGGVMFHAEYETFYLSRRMIDPSNPNQTGKTWAELALIGVGYRQKLGERAALNILLLWEVSNSGYSPYPQNPMIRVNFTL